MVLLPCGVGSGGLSGFEHVSSLVFHQCNSFSFFSGRVPCFLVLLVLLFLLVSLLLLRVRVIAVVVGVVDDGGGGGAFSLLFRSNGPPHLVVDRGG